MAWDYLSSSAYADKFHDELIMAAKVFAKQFIDLATISEPQKIKNLKKMVK